MEIVEHYVLWCLVRRILQLINYYLSRELCVLWWTRSTIGGKDNMKVKLSGQNEGRFCCRVSGKCSLCLAFYFLYTLSKLLKLKRPYKIVRAIENDHSETCLKRNQRKNYQNYRGKRNYTKKSRADRFLYNSSLLTDWDPFEIKSNPIIPFDGGYLINSIYLS